jgi:hypothetical protein
MQDSISNIKFLMVWQKSAREVFLYLIKYQHLLGRQCNLGRTVMVNKGFHLHGYNRTPNIGRSLTGREGLKGWTSITLVTKMLCCLSTCLTETHLCVLSNECPKTREVIKPYQVKGNIMRA